MLEFACEAGHFFPECWLLPTLLARFSLPALSNCPHPKGPISINSRRPFLIIARQLSANTKPGMQIKELSTSDFLFRFFLLPNRRKLKAQQL